MRMNNQETDWKTEASDSPFLFQRYLW